ncbi:MAG: laccase domain-containing protein, partial [Endozoicomonas sp.]
MSSDHRYIHAQWPAPEGIRALLTTRREGVSQGAHASFNMGLYSGDDQEDVWMNRRQIARDFGLSGSPQWLKQVHGTDVIEAKPGGEEQEADAS